MDNISEKDINEYMLSFKIRWLSILEELKSNANFKSYYNWIYATMYNESNLILNIINNINFGNNVKNKLLFEKTKIDFELISNIQKSLILSIKCNTSFWDKYFGKIKKLKMPKNLGEIEFGEMKK
jgi:hypothetical protein